jgi:uncharacterized cupredoxin-like copper-binding protein
MAVLLLVGCSHGGAPHGATARVTERDFHIAAPRQLSAGVVRLLVHNRGPDHHEFLMIRVTGPHLPLRGDGLTVDEDALEKQSVAVVEPAPSGTTTDLHLHLAPGRYELICNMAGHYRGGMHALLTVR